MIIIDRVIPIAPLFAKRKSKPFADDAQVPGDRFLIKLVCPPMFACWIPNWMRIKMGYIHIIRIIQLAAGQRRGRIIFEIMIRPSRSRPESRWSAKKTPIVGVQECGMDYHRTGGVGSELLCGGLNQDCSRAVPDEMNMAPSLGADTQTKFLADGLGATRSRLWQECARSIRSSPDKSENRPARIGQIVYDAVGHVIDPLWDTDRLPSMRHDHEIMLARRLRRRRRRCGRKRSRNGGGEIACRWFQPRTIPGEDAAAVGKPRWPERQTY